MNTPPKMFYAKDPVGHCAYHVLPNIFALACDDLPEEFLEQVENVGTLPDTDMALYRAKGRVRDAAEEDDKAKEKDEQHFKAIFNESLLRQCTKVFPAIYTTDPSHWSIFPDQILVRAKRDQDHGELFLKHGLTVLKERNHFGYYKLINLQVPSGPVWEEVPKALAALQGVDGLFCATNLYHNLCI